MPNKCKIMLTMLDCLRQGSTAATKMAIRGKPLKNKVAAFTCASMESFTQQSRARINCRPNLHAELIVDGTWVYIVVVEHAKAQSSHAHLSKCKRHAMQAATWSLTCTMFSAHPKLSHGAGLRGLCTCAVGHLHRYSSAAELRERTQADPI